MEPRDTRRFRWHPEPELLGFCDEAVSRPALEALGSAAWGEALHYLYAEAMRRPVGPESYVELREQFFGPGGEPSPAPLEPRPSAQVLQEFRDRLAPYQYNSHHPRSFSYFTPPALPMSIVGEILAQWTNQGIDVWHAGPTGALVEEEVVSWLCGLAGYGAGAWGVLTSGGVMANLMALTIARDVHLSRFLGATPRGASLEGTRVYASDQAHFSIARALGMLGFPRETLRVLPSDDAFRLRGAGVASAITADRAAGLRPFAIAAVAGSTNTGSVDRLEELADVAEKEGLWLHVDAAYGGAARFSPRDRGRVAGLERADSITMDPHKWLFQAYDIGGLLVKRRDDLPATFHSSPEYYRTSDPEAEPLNWYQYSMEGTRRFRALKLWLSWKHLGSEGFSRLVEGNNDLAAHLARRCAESEDFEAVPERPDLSVVCFRHLPNGRSTQEDAGLDEHQDELQRLLAASGEGWVSTTRLRGATYLRAGIVNYLSTEEDVDSLLESLRRLGSSTSVR